MAVQRFQAEVRRNQSEKLIIKQDIVETENRVNFLVNRFPVVVERMSPAGFYDLTIHALSVGVPSQLLLNRPDIRQAERELEAAGLEVKVARARFFPSVSLRGSIGYEAFDFRYLFNPQSYFATAAGELVAPILNRKAIRANYLSANARQLEAVYNYQRVVLNAFTEVVNRITRRKTTAGASRSRSSNWLPWRLRSFPPTGCSSGRVSITSTSCSPSATSTTPGRS